MHLYGDHGYGLALGRVDFAWHHRRAGFVIGQVQLAQAAAWARSQPAQVIGDLHKRASEGGERPVGKDQFIVRREGRKLVRVRTKRQSREVGDHGCGLLGKLRMCVQSGTDCCATNGQIVQAVEPLVQALEVAGQQGSPAGYLLLHSGDQVAMQPGCGSDVHRRRERIVRRL